MSRWFRMYADVLDDPKGQKLPAPLFKVWVNILCLASRNDGMLPGLDDIAFALRIDEEATSKHIGELVARGLLDQGDALSPHNWKERQFKSDKDETATERKRAQRERDKKRETATVTPDVTDHVTRDEPVTSHPPEQSRAEADQSREEETLSLSEDPTHLQEVQEFIDDRSEDLTQWETRFLIGIKWERELSKAQLETLNGIRNKLKTTSNGGHVLPSVKRGTPAYDAWIAYYRRRGPATFYEKLDALTVPTEFPPQEKAA